MFLSINNNILLSKKNKKKIKETNLREKIVSIQQQFRLAIILQFVDHVASPEWFEEVLEPSESKETKQSHSLFL